MSGETIQKHVLVVDDEESIRILFQHILQKKGMIIDQAENGQKGLEMLSKKNYDLVITDINMPVLDGFSFYEHSRFAGNKTPFIMATALVRDHQERASAYKIPLFEKPLDLGKIIQKTNEILSPQ